MASKLANFVPGSPLSEALRLGPEASSPDCDAFVATTSEGRQVLVRRLRLEGGVVLALEPQPTGNPSQDSETARAMLESSPDCIKILDLEATLLYFSPGGVASMQVCDLSAVLGKCWFDFWQGEHQLAARSAFERALHGEMGRFQGFCPTMNGSPRWWDVTVSPIRNEAGEVARVLSVSRDITEFRRADDSVRESEERYRSLVSATTSIVWTADAIGRFVDPQDSWQRYTSQTWEQHEGFGWADALHPEDRERTLEAWRRNLAGGGIFESEARLWHAASQTYRRFTVRAVPVKGSEGQIREWIGTCTDVEESWQTSAALRESEERYRLLAELMPELLWTSRPDGSIDYCNERWLGYTGLTADEVQGSGWTRALHPDDQATTLVAWERAVQGGSPYVVEQRLRSASGEYRWFLTRALPLRDDRGRIVKWIGTCSDIETLKRAEQELRESRELARMAIAAGQVGTWTWHIPENHVEWSERTYEFHGVKPGEFDGRVETFAQIVHPEDRARVQAAIMDAVMHDAKYEIDFRVVHPNGAIRWLTTSARVIRSDAGEPLLMLGATADITDRKELEQRLSQMNEELERRVAERTAELENINRELEGFTYSVSHDLRGPLRAIVATSRILLEEHAERLNEEARQHLERQASVASRLGQLIDELLRYSRLSRQEMHRAVVDLSALASEIVAEIEERSETACTFAIEPRLAALGDSKLLRLALVNLFENACKFSPHGGEVTFGREGGAFYVRDQGVGFDMQYAHKLFVPFERLVREEEFPGTGIGLANVKRIIERHGGRVWAEGEKGKGATFYFTLP